jgi:low affinity Fe/Cu permease
MAASEQPRNVADERDAFDRFAERSSTTVAHATFFVGALVLVLVWVPLVAVFESVDTWQLVLNTVTSVTAFLLIALLQNSERRNDRAIHRKLDALAVASAAQLHHELDGDRAALERSVRELEAAVGLEARI